ncbi:MAG: ribosomal RNA small subunit methyltransferase A, partial [Clostridia bacterium]|nr:ribosomal RNA small subunit methyltransferase A [Clostridia bacterium]
NTDKEQEVVETAEETVVDEKDSKIAELEKDLAAAKEAHIRTLAEYDNVEIVFGDVMKQTLIDIENKLGEEYIMVANLPYYITTPIIMRFLENSQKIKAMVIMVQEEVAYRLASKESTSDYGAITVAINLRGSAKVVMRVPREKFTPAPNVDSAVVKIVMDAQKFAGVDFERVRNLVRCAFSSRRKMLVNNIMNTYKMSRADVETALNNCEIKLTVRGENLTAENFVDLAYELPYKGDK